MRDAGKWAAVGLALAALAGGAGAQEGNEGSELRREGNAISAGCDKFDFKAIGKCAYTLFTDHPLHISAGSIAPQNGFGFGPAFVAHRNKGDWRLSADVDAVVSTNRSWRAGGYMTLMQDRYGRFHVEPGKLKNKLNVNRVREQPVFHVLAQAISLERILYFGLGPATSESASAYFGMRETIAGANGAWPLLTQNLALYGEAYGRFVEIRPSTGGPSPSIEQAYGQATAPGLARQPGFAQFAQGLRFTPSLGGDRVLLNYAVTIREYVAADSTYSFQRWTVDAAHQIPIVLWSRAKATVGPTSVSAWQGRQSSPAGPSECGAGAECPTFDEALHPDGPPECGRATHCAAPTRNVGGSFAVSFHMEQSITQAGHVVPFYFQPTLGGSDINGSPALTSYQDYRFRAPNDLLARASFEHSVWGPIGITAMIEEGKVALRGSDLDFTHLRHSYSAGLTLRAGGFPMVWLLFSWGGHEGTHTTGAMNTSLLGGSARPNLY